MVYFPVGELYKEEFGKTTSPRIKISFTLELFFLYKPRRFIVGIYYTTHDGIEYYAFNALKTASRNNSKIQVILSTKRFYFLLRTQKYEHT